MAALDLPIGAVYEHVWRKALNAGDAAARDDDAQNGGRGALRHHLDDDDEDDDDYDDDGRGGGGGECGAAGSPMVETRKECSPRQSPHVKTSSYDVESIL